MSSFLIYRTFLVLLQIFKRTRNKAFSEPQNTFLRCASAKPYQNVWARTFGYFYGGLWVCAPYPPPHTPLPPQWTWDRFWQPRQKSRMASILEAVSMIADFGQQQWSYTNFRLSDRTLRSQDRIFEFSQKLVKYARPPIIWHLRIFWHVGPVQPAGTVRERLRP